MTDSQGRTPAQAARDLKHNQMIHWLWLWQMRTAPRATLDEMRQNMQGARAIVDELYGPNANA